MSMEMTWLDFQLSTDNQNGHQLVIIFFGIHNAALKRGIYR